MVLAELVISSTGLGELIETFRTNFYTADLIAVLIVLMLIGVLGDIVVRRLEVAMVPWKEQK